jgi:hypothetical protein
MLWLDVNSPDFYPLDASEFNKTLLIGEKNSA